MCPPCALWWKVPIRGASARRGWTHEADLLDDERMSDAELTATIADAKAQVLLARIDGKLAGTVTIRDLGKGRAHLGTPCVDPDLQSEGLGRALLADAEDMAAEEFGAKVMTMTVIDARAELIAYYERRGYARTGELRPFPLPVDVPYQMVVLERAIWLTCGFPGFKGPVKCHRPIGPAPGLATRRSSALRVHARQLRTRAAPCACRNPS